jgi:spermidine synthase
VDVYEVKLGEEFLMSSLFTVAEVELARLGLSEANGEEIDVLVGGLGLGYTAVTALEDPRVRSLTVVEALPEATGWHRRQLLPDTGHLADDPRATLLHGDFFALVRDTGGFGGRTSQQYDVILLDVDHTPRHVLHPSHADFYTAPGLESLKQNLKLSGVFALWSDDPPDEEFMAVAGQVFNTIRSEVIEFSNTLTGGFSANTVYIANS